MTPEATGAVAMAGKANRKPAPANPKLSAPSHIIARLELTSDGKDPVKSVADWIGMTQIATLSRLAVWFADQPEAVPAGRSRGHW